MPSCSGEIAFSGSFCSANVSRILTKTGLTSRVGLATAIASRQVV
jgi:hypothetical protein